ncbi:MAG: dihydropteroate synthase [Alistipes indistinctus]
MPARRHGRNGRPCTDRTPDGRRRTRLARRPRSDSRREQAADSANYRTAQPFHPMTTLTVGSHRIDLSIPAVMTIVNVTPDSFYAGSRTSIGRNNRRTGPRSRRGRDLDARCGRVLVTPGAEDVSPGEETRRLAAALEVIRREVPELPVSLDTFRAEVAERIIRDYGPCLINDITAGEADPSMFGTAARLGVPYIAMHMRGMPDNMQQLTDYRDITAEVSSYFEEKMQRLQEAGVQQVILDPGFGFAKTVEQNYELLARMHRLTGLGCPLLAGISRKSMIYKVLDTDPADALTGTTALHWECLRQGAAILRVHDTREAVQVVRLWRKFRENS